MDTTANNSSTTATIATATTTSTVQHVTKKSSDELLRKFADDDDDDEEVGAKKDLRVSKRIKRRRTRKDELVVPVDSICDSPSHALGEKRSLLPLVTKKSRFHKSQLRARDIKNKSILTAIGRTWRKTLEGASKVLLEKHYNRHRRLINDVV
ncbi:hypothetical protein Tsubulata_038769 [Turnera subulata]|uniref:Uncharacterized protein n=1 Tax=Turnera subulata TaxID=218843 RepID=A0A9Q0J7K1_9ROSI|nr:hypothetical protein Tsubulata_038769 [Turnera subulata]